MGHLISIHASSLVKRPKGAGNIKRTEIENIFRRYKIRADLKLTNLSYSKVNIREFKRFANMASSFLTSYKEDVNNTDNFATIFLGRAREWYGRKITPYGICFGIMQGDFRTSIDDEPRYHTVNWFIDEFNRIMIYDVIWKEVYEYKEFMDAWWISV